MSVRQRLTQIIDTTFSTPTERQLPARLQDRDGEAVAVLGGNTPPRRGTAELIRGYSSMPWLRAVSSVIANRVGSTTWRLFITRNDQGTPVRFRRLRIGNRRQRAAILDRFKADDAYTSTFDGVIARAVGDRGRGTIVEEINDHPLLDLLDDPNPIITGVQARRLTQIYVDLAGEGYWLLDRIGGEDTMPIGAWVIPPHWVKRTPSESQPWYEVQLPGGWRGNVPVSEVIPIVDPDPVNPYSLRGSGVAHTLADELETDEYAAKHVKQTFFNRARPDMIVSLAAASPDEVFRFERQWLNQHAGYWRTAKPQFTNRPVKIEPISQTFQELQLGELRKQERDTIIQVFGIPPEILGIIESSNRATIEAADFTFDTYVIEPRLELLRSILQERLVPEFDDRLIIDFDSPVADDKAHQLDVAKAQPHAISVDEEVDPGLGKPGHRDGRRVAQSDVPAPKSKVKDPVE